jgi:pimeloyl-ACP methyl ester carboxylesterase
MQEIDLDLPSGRVHAFVGGPADGDAVICVHGLSANAHSYDDLVPALPEHRVIAFDVRGRGHSEITPPGTYGLAAHAADAAAVATALGVEVFDYVGWSMGALIGIVGASEVFQGGRLRRLVLLDHCGQMDDSATQAVRAGLARLDLVEPTPEAYLEKVRAAGAVDPWTPFWDTVYGYELEQTDAGWTPRTARYACQEDLDYFLAEDWHARWPRVAVPTLLVRATREFNGGHIVPAAEAEGFAAAAPGGVTVVEVDANHFGLMNQDATLDAVRDHLA